MSADEHLTVLCGPERSPCHPAYDLEGGSLSYDGVNILCGACPHCESTVARVNPRTDRKEWLNGLPFYTEKDAVERPHQ